MFLASVVGIVKAAPLSSAVVVLFAILVLNYWLSQILETIRVLCRGYPPVDDRLTADDVRKIIDDVRKEVKQSTTKENMA